MACPQNAPKSAPSTTSQVNNVTPVQPRIFDPIPIDRAVLDHEPNVQLDELYRKMRDENQRLKTFRVVKWPLSYMKCEDLAKSGFFYLLNRDRVQCPFCRGVVCGWEPNDIPIREHQKHYPRCPFLLGYDVGNVPINKDPIRDEKVLEGHDTCGHFHIHSTPSVAMSAIVPRPKVYKEPTNVYEKESGVIPHRGPKSKNQVSLDSRIKSFSGDAFKGSKLTPTQLAEAGFFYIGVADYVKCYYCDGGLCNWEQGDDPWVEHAHWFPDCHYIILNKGLSFVEACEKKPSKAGSVDKPYALNDDILATKAVKTWMTSKMVIDLLTINSYSPDMVKAALHRRWVDKQMPFEDFSDLHSAVEKSVSGINEPQPPTGIDSEDEESKSGQESQTSSISPSSSPNDLGYLSSTSSNEQGERLLCKICLDREIGVVFLPCGHFMACTQCAPGVTDCPICRKSIKGTVRTFFS